MSSPTDRLVLAASQFPVSADVAENAGWIAGHLEQAAEAGARLLLTPEAALTGYPPADFDAWARVDWAAVGAETARLSALAAERGLWLVLGSAHPLVLPVVDEARPTNCLYVFGPDGDLVDRYDKSQLTDTDQAFYTAGSRPVVVEVGGLKLGLLVCYDVCYPEMYARYRGASAKSQVDVVLHAFYNAGFGGPNVLDEVKPAWLRARAADNQVWIVAANSSKPHASWGNKIVRPDGSVAAELRPGEPGVLLHEFPDDSLAGWLHNFTPLRLHEQQTFSQGRTSSHPRALDGQSPPIPPTP